MIPSVAQCTQLMVQYEMLANIKDHSFVVARITDLLSKELSRSGVGIDGELAVAGALLHDIAKTQCLESRCSHAEVGVEICLAHGFPEVAEIVGEHVVLSDFSPSQLSAKEVVYYADKRVNHDKIVTLQERLDYIVERYGKGDPQLTERIFENFKKCCRIEERIFSFLDFHPDQVPGLVMTSGALENEYAEVG
jgi:putative nucleotidyltransferase with HDIG domain